MKTKAEELRELRDKIIHNGDVPIDFGCEVKLEDYSDRIQVLEVLHDDSMWCRFADEDNWFDRIDKIDPYATYKILGKPTSWGEVLRMLNREDNHVVDLVFCNEKYAIQSNSTHNGKPIIYIELDLTKSPEEQEPEVIEKLVKLLK